MNKTVLIVLGLLLGILNSYAQVHDSKWKSSAYIDLMSDYKNVYDYRNSDDETGEMSIPNKGALEIGYNLDYQLFRRLAISAIVSYGQNKFTGASIKMGGGLKLFYVEDKFYYLTLQYGYKLPFNRDYFSDAHQLRFGQWFDVGDIKKCSLLVGVFFCYDFYYLHKAKPLFFQSNTPEAVNFHSWGLSLGLTF